MNQIHLDCSSLHNIRVDKGDLPNSIYIDGQDFINRINSIFHEFSQSFFELVPKEKTKEEKRWELIIALSGNSQLIAGDSVMGHGVIKTDMRGTAKRIIAVADEILKTLEVKS